MQVPASDLQNVYSAIGQTWADPSVPEAAQWLRHLADNPAARAALEKRGKVNVDECLGLSAFGKAISEALYA